MQPPSVKVFLTLPALAWIASVVLSDVNTSFVPAMLATLGMGVIICWLFADLAPSLLRAKLRALDLAWIQSIQAKLLTPAVIAAILLTTLTADLAWSRTQALLQTMNVSLTPCKTKSKLPHEVLLRKNFEDGVACFRLNDGNDLKIGRPYKNLNQDAPIIVSTLAGQSLLFGGSTYYFSPSVTTNPKR